jgi:acetoin utilization protein AcuB
MPMLVRDWMKTTPTKVSSDTLVTEAKRLLIDNNLNALLVVDDGRLRGLITRHNIMRMSHYVMRTQNADEVSFFVNRLKVRDIMVRRPATLQADDTIRHSLRYGNELMVAQFPVLDGEQVVGIISAKEIFQLAAHFAGALDKATA